MGKHRKTVDRLADTENTVTLQELQRRLAREAAKREQKGGRK